MGRTHSPTDDAWLLLKISAADQALYDAEMRDYFNPREPTPNPYDGTVDLNLRTLEPWENTGTTHVLYGRSHPPLQDATLGDVTPTILPPTMQKPPGQMGLSDYPRAFTQPQTSMSDVLYATEDARIEDRIAANRKELERMYRSHLEEMGGTLDDMSFEDYIRSALSTKHPFSLSRVFNQEDEAERVKDIINQGGISIDSNKPVQTELGQFHPRLPSSATDAWVEGSTTPPMGMVRIMRPETVSRQFLNPKTNEIEKVPPGRNIRNRVLAGGIPGLINPDNRGFEDGGYGANYRKLDTNQPGHFWSGISLEDLSKISTGESLSRHGVYGSRDLPQNIMAQIRDPKEAPERLHEIYAFGHMPAQNVFDPFTLTSGANDARMYNYTTRNGEKHDIREHGLRYGDYETAAQQLVNTLFPGLVSLLDRQGEPLTINSQQLKQILHDGNNKSEYMGEQPTDIKENLPANNQWIDNFVEKLEDKYGKDIDMLHALSLLDKYAHDGWHHDDRFHPNDPRKMFVESYLSAIPGMDEKERAYQNERILQRGYASHRDTTVDQLGHLSDIKSHLHNSFIRHISNVLHIPQNVVARQLERTHASGYGSRGLSVGNMAMVRHMYHAAKENEMPIRNPITSSVQMPLSEHGYPQNNKGEDLHGKVLEKLTTFPDEGNNLASKILDESYRNQVAVRHPIYGKRGEEKLLQPPTGAELEALGENPEVFNRQLLDYFYMPELGPPRDTEKFGEEFINDKMERVKEIREELQQLRAAKGQSGRRQLYESD